MYECGGDIGTHNFEYQRLNVFIVDTFNISVLSLCTKHIRFYYVFQLFLAYKSRPIIQWAAAYAVQYGQKALLIRRAIHIKIFCVVCFYCYFRLYNTNSATEFASVKQKLYGNYINRKLTDIKLMCDPVGREN